MDKFKSLFIYLFLKSSKNQNGPGIDYGLSLTLGPLVKSNKYSTGLSFPPYGLKVLIHNSTFPPLFFETFLSLSPGQETSIIVERTYTSNEHQPYSECTDLTNGFNSVTYNWMMNNNKTYRQNDCLFYR